MYVYPYKCVCIYKYMYVCIYICVFLWIYILYISIYICTCTHATAAAAKSLLSHFSQVWLFATPWTIACQTPLSMEFPRQEYRRGLPCSPPGDLTDSGIEPVSLMSPALAGGFFTTLEMFIYIYITHRDMQHT